MGNLSDKDFYVYRHVRLDTSRPFYIGEGRMSKNRAYSKSGRNKHWKNIVNKCGYRVEIIISNLTKEQSLDKEVWFKKFYNKCGYKLANKIIGRESKGYKHSKDSIKSRIRKLTGRKLSEQHINNIPTKFKKGCIPWNKGKNRPNMVGKKYAQKYGKVYCVELQTMYNSPREASLALGIHYTGILRVCLGKRKSAGKKTFIFKKDMNP